MYIRLHLETFTELDIDVSVHVHGVYIFFHIVLSFVDRGCLGMVHLNSGKHTYCQILDSELQSPTLC